MLLATWVKTRVLRSPMRRATHGARARETMLRAWEAMRSAAIAAAESPNLVKSQKLRNDSKTMPPAKESMAKRLEMVMMGRRALALKGLARKVFARDPDEVDPPSSPPWASPASVASLLSRPLTLAKWTKLLVREGGR